MALTYRRFIDCVGSFDCVATAWPMDMVTARFWLVVILAVLAGYASVWLSPVVFGDDSVTPMPEPTQGTIPPLLTPFPFPPIAPQTDRSYLPVVFGGNPCSDDLFYLCSTMPVGR